MGSLVSIFLGGGIGACLRYLLKIFCDKNLSLIYPFGTFFANILGCLFIGFVVTVALNKAEFLNTNLKLFLTVGIAGGFTTFSTFSLESFEFIKQGNILLSLLYMASSIVFGLIAIYIGMTLARYL